jgi:U3 small nucleolar RNA-associated protein 11
VSCPYSDYHMENFVVQEQMAEEDVPIEVTEAKKHDDQLDLGWKPVVQKKQKRPPLAPDGDLDIDRLGSEDAVREALEHRQHLLKELAARLERDKYLGYAQRELEMQRLMMGKGRRQKISAPERIRDADDKYDVDDEDAIDARGGRRRNVVQKAPGMDTFKPRVYKWKVERKR